MKPKLGCAPILIVAVTLFTGCSHFVEKRAQRDLEMVARRWCMTIRASQIIPIYPLNEDVQPGDVFVVETPAQRQAADYDKRGYLDLEHLLVRLNPASYHQFYSGGYDTSQSKATPRHWQFPDSHAWTNAPLAGFPSYSIKVKKGGGFSAAFPISGIPVGLSFLDSAQANVTVQITSAHTYGLDQFTLEPPFRSWLSTNAHLSYQYARPTNGNRTAYLRLITRVFAANAINVTVTGDQSTSFAGSGGAAKEVGLPMLLDANAVANYTNSINSLDRIFGTLANSAPGGTLKLASASSRSVSMNEVFARPLVIGYIAQDYPILPDGRLGNPISTKDVLEGRVPDPLAASLAQLREEQQSAGLVASQCVSKLRELTVSQFKQATVLSHQSAAISTQEKDAILAQAKDRPKQAAETLSDAILRKSRSGDVRARCDLLVLRDALLKL